MPLDQEIIDYVNERIAHTHNGVNSPLVDKTANGISSSVVGTNSGILIWGGQSLGGSVVAYYAQNVQSTTEADVQMQVPKAGTISNFYLTTYTAQPGTGNYVLTLRKNGVGQTLKITINSSAGAGFFSDTTHSFTVVAGDKICIQGNNAAATSAASISTFSFLLT